MTENDYPAVHSPNSDEQAGRAFRDRTPVTVAESSRANAFFYSPLRGRASKR